MLSKKYKLLVFDWDGTLVDSIDKIVTSLQVASFNACNLKVSESDAKDVIGMGLNEAIRKLHPEIDTDSVDEIAQAYKHHYQHENEVTEEPFEGVTELLSQLKESGFLLAIATGKSRPGFEHSANSHALFSYFHTTQCSGENRSKPHPEMLNRILAELKIAAEDAVMIGDSIHDLLMAKNAGVEAIAVTHGVHTETELSVHAPLTCLKKITDLDHYLHHNSA